MSVGVRLKVWGPFALFGRPEFAAERVSYDVMTPSAARGILEAIHWKPAIRWVVDRIRVRRPIRLETVRRNEVGSKLALRTALSAMRDPSVTLAQYADEDRQQRASVLLRDVEYVVEAHFEMTNRAEPGDNPGKHADMARRRIARGQCVQQPCFGMREFPAYFEPAGDDDLGPPPDALLGERDLGWMLYDVDHDADAAPHFFQGLLRDGVLDLPPPPFRPAGLRRLDGAGA